MTYLQGFRFDIFDSINWRKILAILKLYPAAVFFGILTGSFHTERANRRLGFNWEIANTVYGLARVERLVHFCNLLSYFESGFVVARRIRKTPGIGFIPFMLRGRFGWFVKFLQNNHLTEC
jgi:hypothetical protein